jgi:integrase
VDEYRVGPDHPEAPLFTARSGAPFTENGLYQVFHRLKVVTGIGALCPHALRHYWAERYDGDVIDLKRAGGWNGYRTPERYRQGGRPRHRKSTLASALALTTKRMSPRHISALRVVGADAV